MHDDKVAIMRCAFHFSQSVRKRFTQNLSPEITPSNPNFKREVQKFYLTVLNMTMIPLKLVEPFTDFLIRNIDKQSFTD